LQRSPDMASVFGHVLASTAIGMAFFPKQSRNMLILGGICAFLPDADVLGFYWGVSYSSQWGHRGCTHSIVFALLIGLLALAVYRNTQRRSIAWYLLLATLSHPLLDMLTNGGRGVALWWPVSVQRIFFPCRPIQVSPIGITIVERIILDRGAVADAGDECAVLSQECVNRIILFYKLNLTPFFGQMRIIYTMTVQCHGGVRLHFLSADHHFLKPA
jgi:inner membrane protein